MSIEQNKMIMRRMIDEIWNKGNVWNQSYERGKPTGPGRAMSNNGDQPPELLWKPRTRLISSRPTRLGTTRSWRKPSSPLVSWWSRNCS